MGQLERRSRGVGTGPPSWRELPEATQRLIAVLSVLAAGATVRAAVGGGQARPVVPVAAAFAGCAGAAVLLARWRTPASVHSPGRAVTRHVVDTVHVSAVLLLPAEWLPAVAVISTVALARRPRRWPPVAFNLARTVLMLLAGSAALSTLGGASVLTAAHGRPGRLLAAVVVAGLVMWVVSTAASLLVLATETGRWPRGSGLLAAPTVGCWTGELAVGALAAGVAVRAPVLLALVVPLVAVLRAQVGWVAAELVSQLDSKTGLVNAGAFRRRGDLELRHTRRNRDTVTLVMLDADHLRRVNNTRGHLAGDAVLAAIAARLSAHVRAGDVLARFGGEEFAVLMPATSLVDGRRVAERLRAAVAATPVPLDGGATVAVTVSGGVATHRRGGDLDDLLRRADAALYRAKALGRDRILVDDSPRDVPAGGVRTLRVCG